MSKKANDKENNTKQSIKEVVSNNLFLLKLMFLAAPSYILLMGLDAVRGQLSIFFEHTVGIGYVLEAAEFGYPFREVAKFILILAFFITLGMAFTVFVGEFIGEKAKPKIRQKIKLKLYEKARDLDLECYDNPEFYNEQVLALSETDKQIDRMLTLVQNFMTGITILITSSIYIMSRDKLAIVFVIVSFSLSFFLTQAYNKRNYKVTMESLPSSRKRDYIKRIYYLSDYAKELRLNPKLSDLLLKKFDEANDEVYKVEKKYTRSKLILGFLKSYGAEILIADMVFITYLIYLAAVKHTISYSSVAILFASFDRLRYGLRTLTEVYPFASENSLYISKIRKFLKYEPKIKSTKGLIPSDVPHKIDINDISFSYGSLKESTGDTIRNLSLSIKPGEKIALVGYNGAGKTTLVKLLMRLYDVDSGVIYSDGQDIKNYDLKKYRETIGTVFQDFQIFAGSIRENILLDSIEDKSLDEDIVNALDESGFKVRLESLKTGLDTELTTEFSKDGMNLSGGESQKLAIARVFYKKSGLMILDEPSSALDPIAEYQLNHAMLSATKDKTVIFISHRLSTTRIADRIIMLEKGVVVEEGSHEQLLKKNGKYATMWKLQAGAYINV